MNKNCNSRSIQYAVDKNLSYKKIRRERLGGPDCIVLQNEAGSELIRTRCQFGLQNRTSYNITLQNRKNGTACLTLMPTYTVHVNFQFNITKCKEKLIHYLYNPNSSPNTLPCSSNNHWVL